MGAFSYTLFQVNNWSGKRRVSISSLSLSMGVFWYRNLPGCHIVVTLFRITITV